jgi:hypothetical protein
MLTSEKAALAVCHQIQMEQERLCTELNWIDPDWGPKRKSDLERCKKALYKTGEPPNKGFPDPKDVEFVSVVELCASKGKVPKFAEGGVSSNDCKQGNLGDCWLISALATVANRDELLMGGKSGMQLEADMIVDQEVSSLLSKGVYPPIFHRYRRFGLYVISLFINFNWIYVLVDDRIPVNAQTRKPIFGRCRAIDEIWVSIIEKAQAKLYGCYENLTSGYVDEGVQSLTGF